MSEIEIIEIKTFTLISKTKKRTKKRTYEGRTKPYNIQHPCQTLIQFNDNDRNYFKRHL